MNFKESICAALTGSDFIVQAYLGDLTPQELMSRPAPGANHVAWQLGHVIGAERHLADLALPGAMPELPAGFREKHSKEAAFSDDPGKFLSKAEYVAIAREVRAATLKLLDRVNEADMSRPIDGKAPPFVKLRGDALATIAPHWLLHAGQWAVLRRALGRARMF
jgi:hypothetical protein